MANFNLQVKCNTFYLTTSYTSKCTRVHWVRPLDCHEAAAAAAVATHEYHESTVTRKLKNLEEYFDKQTCKTDGYLIDSR